MNKVTRTDKVTRPDWVMGGNPQAILLQEAAGQRQLAESDILPTDMGHDGKTRATLEGYGVKFLGVVAGDPMFQNVELPPGWKKIPTDHSMWSKLIDDQGRERAAIFYKAAFYDRSAHLHLTRRFSVNRDWERKDVCAMSVADAGTVIHVFDPVPLDEPVFPGHGATNQAKEEYRRAYLKAVEKRDAFCKTCEDWLTAKYPEWRDPSKYWDAPQQGTAT